MNDFWMLEMYIKAWKESSLKVQLNKLKDLDFADFRNLYVIINDQCKFPNKPVPLKWQTKPI